MTQNFMTLDFQIQIWNKKVYMASIQDRKVINMLEGLLGIVKIYFKMLIIIINMDFRIKIRILESNNIEVIILRIIEINTNIKIITVTSNTKNKEVQISII